MRLLQSPALPLGYPALGVSKINYFDLEASSTFVTVEAETELNLKGAIETANYANYANRQGFLKNSRFIRWVQCFVAPIIHCVPLFSRISWGSRFMPTAESTPCMT